MVQGLGFDLSDPFPGDSVSVADLFKGLFFLVEKAKAGLENFSLFFAERS